MAQKVDEWRDQRRNYISLRESQNGVESSTILCNALLIFCEAFQETLVCCLLYNLSIACSKGVISGREVDVPPSSPPSCRCLISPYPRRRPPAPRSLPPSNPDKNTPSAPPIRHPHSRSTIYFPTRHAVESDDMGRKDHTLNNSQ